MPPLRNSRKAEIPHGLIINWRTSGARDGKPLVRRPATACELCRAAKVKCSGQLDCDRCKARGSPCRYPSPPRSESTEPPPFKPLSRTTDAGPAIAQVSCDNINMDLASDSPPQLGLEESLWTGQDWPNDVGQQGMDAIDWSDVNITSGLRDKPAPWSPGAGDLSAFQSWAFAKATAPEDPMHQSALSLTATSSNTTTASQSTPRSSMSTQPSPPNARSCQCRTSLLQLGSKVAIGVQERRPDIVFKVTGDVIRSCQTILDCSSCEVGCSDLLCMAAVLQQTDGCFEYVVKANLAGAIKISVGDYEVPNVDNSRVRQWLVMGIVNQATTLWNSIASKSQQMFQATPVSCRAGQITLNFNYLKAVMESSRDVLDSVASLLNEEDIPSPNPYL